MAALLAGTCSVAQVGPSSSRPAPASPRFTIVIGPVENPCKAGGPLLVTFLVTNISDEKIAWRSERAGEIALKEYSYLLRRDGREAKTTVLNRRLTGRQRPDDPPEVEQSTSILLLHSQGVMFTIKVDLTRLYEINEPGEYTLDISRFDEDSNTAVHSNTLRFKVSP